MTLRLVFGSKEERDQKVAKYYAAEGARQSLDRNMSMYRSIVLYAGYAKKVAEDGPASA